MLYNNWIEYCRNNMYSFESLITWDNITYLTYDLITKMWVIGKVNVSDKGIESCRYSNILFFNTTIEAVNAFKTLIK